MLLKPAGWTVQGGLAGTELASSTGCVSEAQGLVGKHLLFNQFLRDMEGLWERRLESKRAAVHVIGLGWLWVLLLLGKASGTPGLGME